MQETVNEAGNDGGSVTEVLPKRRFDAKTVRAQLDALRAKHGADTPIGHRCSNLIEMMKNRETATPDLRRDLDKYITAAVEDLARLGPT
jgi:hypothetical protein